MAVAVVNVPGRAGADPRREFVGDLAVVGALAGIAEVSRDQLPLRPVAGARSGQGVRDLVQQDLVHVVVAVARCQVAGHCYAPHGEVAQPRPFLSVVECEGPAGVKVQCDQGVRPVPHPVEVGHQGATVTW